MQRCVTVIVNIFVVLLNLSIAVPIVELFAGTSFDPINISEKVVILCPGVDSSSLLQDDKLTKEINENKLINFFMVIFFCLFNKYT
jgi:hypothetical protein